MPLKIIIGPMFSGKTTKLVDLYNSLTGSDVTSENILVINHNIDTRTTTGLISTHDFTSKVPCVHLEHLMDAVTTPSLSKQQYILINEAQFFPDLKVSVIKLVEQYCKTVIICGLDSDYKREKFGDIWDLIPHADCIIKLKGQCNNCMDQSLFTHRVSNEKDQEVIGTNNYIPLCRKCYAKLNP